MKESVTYTHRLNGLSATRTYRLTESALTWSDEGSAGGHALPFTDITEVRLAYRPSRVQRNRFLARITPREGPSIEISNSSFRGFADFEEHNGEYSGFLRALHAKLARAGTSITFRKGSSVAGYVVNLLLTAWIAAMIVLAAVLLFAWGMVWIAFVKLAIVLFFVPTLARFILRARPGTYDPLDIPEGALPRA